MANKKQKKKVKDKGAEVVITLNTPADLPFYYVNHLEVSQSPFDFSITGGCVPARMTKTQIEEIKKGELTISPSVQLLIPARVLPGLIRALQSQLIKYEENYGKLTAK